MLGVNIGIPVPREPFSFGGMYGTLSKFGTSDITGDGAMEFFSNRRKVGGEKDIHTERERRERERREREREKKKEEEEKERT